MFYMILHTITTVFRNWDSKGPSKTLKIHKILIIFNLLMIKNYLAIRYRIHSMYTRFLCCYSQGICFIIRKHLIDMLYPGNKLRNRPYLWRPKRFFKDLFVGMRYNFVFFLSHNMIHKLFSSPKLFEGSHPIHLSLMF